MLQEALKSLRAGLLTAFVLVLIWALALPMTVAELRARQGAEQLTTWLLLNNEFPHGFVDDDPNLAQFHERFVPTSANSTVIDAEMKDPPPETADLRGGGDNPPTAQAITVSVQWPEEKSEVVLKLAPRDIAAPYEIYEVRSDARFLPFDQYDVVIDKAPTCRHCVLVLGRADWAMNPRMLQFAVNRRNQPNDWDDIRARLWIGAPEQTPPSDLRLGSGPVVSFIKDTWSTQHSLWGVSVDAGLFFVAPGILLGAQAIALLAPLLVLMGTRQAPPGEALWVMAIATHRPRRRLIELVLIVASIVWILVPVGIAVAQAVQGVQLHRFEQACYWIGGVGLSVAVVVYAITMYQLWRLRRIMIDEQP